MNKNEFLDLEVGSDVVSYQSNNIFNILEFSENAQKIKMKRWKDSKVFSYSQLYFLKQFCVSEITTAETCWNTYAKAVGGKTFDGKPLPKFKDLKQQKIGWIAVAKLIRGK